MKKTALLIACIPISFALGLGGPRLCAGSQRGTGFVFEELGLHLEVDLPAVGARAPAGLLELPAEVVLSAAAPVGLSRVSLLSADGRCLLQLESMPGQTLGVAEVELESEGATLGAVLDAYPPGLYRVEATLFDGSRVQSTTTLSAAFPGPFQVTSPAPGALVPAGEATLTWTPARGAKRYTLEIEAEELGFELRTTLPATQTAFTIPAGLLVAGQPYEYSLAVQGDTDNELELEGAFATAGPALPGASGLASAADR